MIYSCCQPNVLAASGFHCGEPVTVSILNETLHFKQNVHSPIVEDLSTRPLYRLRNNKMGYLHNISTHTFQVYWCLAKN